MQCRQQDIVLRKMRDMISHEHSEREKFLTSVSHAPICLFEYFSFFYQIFE